MRTGDQAQPRPSPEGDSMMNDSTRVIGQSQRAWPPTARTVAAVIATAVLALLAVACSGGSPSSAGSGGSSSVGGSTNSQKALAYSRCMRSHGVPKFPDANSSNELPSGLPKSLLIKGFMPPPAVAGLRP